jgi:hypothetical protein
VDDTLLGGTKEEIEQFQNIVKLRLGTLIKAS